MMRRALLLMLVLVLPCLAVADDGGGQPLICFSNYNANVATYFPRGDHWALAPGLQITLSFNPNGPANGPQTNAPGASAGNAAVAAASAVWASTSCGGSKTPNISFNTTGTWDFNTVVSGDQINSIIWQPIWPIDAGTVAATTNTFESDTGLIVDADLQFNSQDFNWRITSTGAGCNPAIDPNCYDIETVSLHEFGHFLGFNHVACSTAVMFQSAAGSTNNNQLSTNEKAGVCALYAPRTSGSASAFGELCAQTSDCQSGLCLKPANGTATGRNGWCTTSCTSSADCPTAFICEAVTSQGPTCVPGIHLAGVPVDDVTATSDICQPCKEGANCNADLCVLDPNGSGICSQPCSTDGAFACPPGFACIQAGANVCYPVDNTVCPGIWQGVKFNSVCYSPEVNNDANSLINLPCENNLACLLFPSGIGACLEECNAVGLACPSGQECCFGFDSNGQCLNSSATAGTGGCIQVQPTGASCVLPSQAVCNSNATCFYASSPTLAECYDTCNTGTCPTAGETCVQMSSTLNICCDQTYWNGDPNTCHPKKGVCQRETDVVCTQNSDCQSGLCQTYNNQSFCTVPCVVNTDCPSVGTDVNGDNKPDGGGTCTAIGSRKLCVPNTGPAAAPACATAATDNGGGGCGCTSTGPGDFIWLATLALIHTWRARDRYRARLLPRA